MMAGLYAEIDMRPTPNSVPVDAALFPSCCLPSRTSSDGSTMTGDSSWCCSSSIGTGLSED